MTRSSVAAMLMLAVGLVGCGDYLASGARLRASSEFACPADSLRVDRLGAGGYRVTGCGQRASYTCVAGRGVTCVHDAERSSTSTSAEPARAAAESTAWPNTAVRTMLASIHDQVLACFVAPHVPATMRVIIGRTGRIADSSMVTDATPDELRCAREVLGGVQLEGSHFPRAVALSFAPHAQVITPSAGGEAAQSADPQWDVESALRDAVDAHASTILVCTSQQPVAVAIAWSADGALSVSLRGALHGTPEEGCVARALSDLHVPATGHDGTILHPVQPD